MNILYTTEAVVEGGRAAHGRPSDGRLAVELSVLKEIGGEEGGETMTVIEKYKRAIENSDEHLLREVFAPQVHIEIPAGASLDHPVNTASHMMSQVAQTAPGIKCVLTADAGNNWYFLGFEGQIEGHKLQAVDQVHLNKDGKIDRLIIYMRPIPAAQKFAEIITQRLRPTR